MIDVRVVPVELVLPLGRLAAKDHINIKPDQRMVTTWFGAFRGAHLIGFAGVAQPGAHRWRLRALWVVPSERGQGASVALAAARFRYIIERAEPSDLVQLFHNQHRPLDFWQARGLRATGRRLRGGRGAIEMTCTVAELTVVTG